MPKHESTGVYRCFPFNGELIIARCRNTLLGCYTQQRNLHVVFEKIRAPLGAPLRTQGQGYAYPHLKAAVLDSQWHQVLMTQIFYECHSDKVC